MFWCGTSTFEGFEKYRVLTQYPKGLAFIFNDKRLFATKQVKICNSSLWCPYSCLIRHYSVVHNFFRFSKISSCDAKPNGVSLRFYRQTSVHSKNRAKIIFHRRQAHIPDWSCNSNLGGGGGKPSLVAKNVCSIENKPKIQISSIWDPYSIPFWRFGDVHKILGVFKNIEFWLKNQRVSLWFYRQTSVHDRNGSKSVFHPHEAHIPS
jgi:hypothetical protein